MPVTRTYKCSTEACGHEFKHFHYRGDEPYPKCPQCGDDPNWVPTSFATTTVKAKAMDYAANMMGDYGLTDMADSGRAGDVAAKGPAPIQSAERDQIMQSMAEVEQAARNGVSWGWHGGGGSGTAAGPNGPAAVARADGVDPLALLHDAGKQGKVTMTAEVVGASDISGELRPERQGSHVAL